VRANRKLTKRAARNRARKREAAERRSKRTVRAPAYPIGAEFASARLGDKRRTKRLVAVAEAMSAAPGRSLPEIAKTSAALEGLYRFINPKRYSLDAARILESHGEASEKRARGHGTVLVVHDGTDLVYPYEGELRAGFGRLGNQQGIQALVSLTVAFAEHGESLTSNDDHEPLGVAACQTWVGARARKKTRKKRPKKKKKTKRTGTRWGRIGGDEWYSSVRKSREVLGSEATLIHVIDREADGIGLFGRLIADGEHFVIRVMRKRRVAVADQGADEFVKIVEAANQLPRLFEERIAVAKRCLISEKQTNPPRDARLATLTFAAGEIRIKKSWELGSDSTVPDELSLNLVHVKERDAPKGQEPVEWFLVTTEPIRTDADVRRVVRIYRARWLIEELFRVLKSGCSIEKRQVESRTALEVILGISLVVAWRLMLLRHKSRADPSAPAGVCFTAVELDLLQRMRGLSSNGTVQEALLLVARMGGHIKNNGPPGNVVLARGLEKLDAQAEVWAFAMAERSDR